MIMIVIGDHCDDDGVDYHHHCDGHENDDDDDCDCD